MVVAEMLHQAINQHICKVMMLEFNLKNVINQALGVHQSEEIIALSQMKEVNIFKLN
jgi:hypothetical protein